MLVTFRPDGTSGPERLAEAGYVSSAGGGGVSDAEVAGRHENCGVTTYRDRQRRIIRGVFFFGGGGQIQKSYPESLKLIGFCFLAGRLLI